MGDPLSVAASVAGLISLGISTIQGLVDYYQAYRSQSTTINRLAQRLSNLLGTLQSLDATLKKRILRAGEEEVVSQVESSVQSCEDIIGELRSQLDRLQLAPKHAFTAAAVNFGKKVTYPFKSSTLLKLDEDVGEFRENLSLALSVLQLHDNSVAQKDFEQLQSLLALVRSSQLSSTVQTWLNAPDPTVNHNAHWAKRHPSTGLWLLQSSVFISWLTSPGSSLWLTGFAGTGKSVLCSTVIQEIFQHRACDTGIAIAFYYFTFTDSAKQDLTGLLKSLVVQIANQQKNGGAELSELHKSHPDTPSDQVLAEHLLKQVAQFEHTYIMVDALDEVPKNSRKSVLMALAKFQTWPGCNLHLLFTSRDLVEIRDVVVPFAQECSMNTAAIDEDITSFVAGRLQTDPALARLASFHDEITTSLTSRANGVFRWVECQLDVLADCPKSRTLVTELLQTLPATLDETYSRMLSNINTNLRKTARRILHLLCAAYRPLTVDEICCAIAVELGEEPKYDENAVLADEHDILKLCPGFVIVDHVKLHTVVWGFKRYNEYFRDISVGDIVVPLIRLAHFSVLEYLRSDRLRDDKDGTHFVISDAEMHAETTFTCLVYLTTLRPRQIGINLAYTRSEIDAELVSLIPEEKYELLPASYLLKLVAKYPFFIYAACYWTKHYRQCCGKSFRPMDKILQRFMDDAAAFRRWWISSHYEEDGTASFLYYASLLGLTQFAVYCIEAARANRYGDMSKNAVPSSVSLLVNQKGGKHNFALQAAIRHGYKDIVSLLLENGADINATISCGRPALEVAIRNGYVDIVALLLEKGANTNILSLPGNTTLEWVCVQGNADIVSLLSRGGVDINITNNGSQTALWAASVQGRADRVIMLLDKGTNVNAITLYGGTALEAASKEGNTEVVALLLGRGADPNAMDANGNIALISASRRGHAEIVALLLEKGAAVDRKDNHGITALHQASYYGHVRVVALLLENGAYPNVTDDGGTTALQQASSRGHAVIVDLLLEKGAAVGYKDDDGTTALEAASCFGIACVVALLLEKGADANVTNDSGMTALQQASYHGHADIVALLLEKGANVNAQGGKYFHALIAACDVGHIEVARLLLAKGADVNVWVTDHRGSMMTATPLYGASWSGSLELVQLLITNGADVERYGSEALRIAKAMRHSEIMQFLLSRGARPVEGEDESQQEDESEDDKFMAAMLEYAPQELMSPYVTRFISK